jgi:endonuclease/exonuclease/phosphatase family metal-dependent hydrolase
MRGGWLAGLLACGWAATAAAAEPAGLVRVMSFNIRFGTARDGANHWDQRRQFLADTITAFDPDLLGTQETLAAQRDFLAGKLPGYTAFAAGRDDGRDGGEMAALFFRTERFEKLDGGHFWLSPEPEAVGRKGWDAALPRIATWVRLRDRQTPGLAPILFLNTHFDHRGRAARLESARLIRRKLGELGAGCRLVLTGDFNAGEGSEPHAALFDPVGDQPARLVDTFRVVVPERGPHEGTFHGFNPAATDGPRIDWIGCSTDWEVRAAGIDRVTRDGRPPSDHFPITAVLRPVVPGRPATFRAVSYNIHHGRGADDAIDLPRVARVIRAADPDLVLLQEVDQRTRRSGGVDQAAELARLTGLHAAFGKAIDYAGGGYGQALLSRLPLREPTVHPLPGDAADEPRIAFAARTTALGRDTLVISTHLHHRSAAARERQAARLNELFGGLAGPALLGGDFNAPPDSPPMTLLARQWAVATAGPNLATFPAGNPARQIDFILTRPAAAFRVVEARVVAEAVASDHRPIIAVLERSEP